MKKYELVEQWIHEQFQNGSIQPGERLPSESELCRRFSVSRNAVRQAMANLRASGDILSIDKVGSFRTEDTGDQNSHTGNIGIITYKLESYVFPQIIRGSGKVLDNHGYHLLLGHSDYQLEKERTLLEDFLEKGVEGLIIEPIFAPNRSNNESLLMKFESQNIPVVLLDNAYADDRFNSVVLDDRKAGRIAASYLLEHGHSNIGIVSEDEYYPKVMRQEGAREFLEEQGITLNPENLIITHSDPTVGSEAAYNVMLGVFARESFPRAYICTSDEDAMGLIRAARESGMDVPEDISVIGHDNWNHNHMIQPRLTTFEYPGEAIGQMAAKIIMERIKGSGMQTRTTTVIQPKIVEGDSVQKL